MIRLLIASPFPAMRAGLRILLNQPDFQLVDDVTTNDEILDLADTLTPQVIVYDLALDPDGNFEALIQFRRTLPMVRVLGLSESPADPRIMRAMQAGMRGCLPKTAAGDELAVAVRRVADGEVVLPPTAANALLQRLGSEAAMESLTQREIQVLRAVAAGQTNKAIALKLGISEHTVKFHLGSAMSKLGAASRA
ncbi:MAG TPA: response regulator transcription factor, partial [Anaerolineales bacterium]|nr:response regulator transcription factor [Anaerolineales bacterium]